MDKPKRIAFDAKRAFANARGLGNYSRDTIRLLSAYASQNEYFYCGIPSARFSPQFGTTISPQGMWRYFPALWRMRGCLTSLQQYHVDIYHGLSGELPIGIHRTGIQTIVTMHDAIFMRYPELYSIGYRHLFANKVRYACAHADVIIAISEQTKRDIITYFHADERKIRVVYQGCNNQFRKPISKEEVQAVRSKYCLPDQYLLYVGALERRKNLYNLQLAMESAHIDVPLVYVGAPSKYGETLRQLSIQCHQEIYFLHGIPFTDFPALYKGAEVFVYPSVFEGFGIPILEAMCVGTPVLTSTGSCFEETGGRGALYADPNDVEAIGKQLAMMLADSSLRKQMIQEGYKQSEKFTDDEVARHLLEIYDTL